MGSGNCPAGFTRPQESRVRFSVMDFTVRPATVEDAKAIAVVQVEGWRSTYGGIVPDAYLAAMDVESRTESWKEPLGSSEVVSLVAEDAAGVFGFVCGGKIREEIMTYDGELYAIYLLKDRQRHGAGRTLACTLAEVLRQRGLKSMVVWVLEENRRAVAFYQGLGAVQIVQKMTDIGGAELSDLCLGWADLHSCLDGQIGPHRNVP